MNIESNINGFWNKDINFIFEERLNSFSFSS